MDLLCRFVDLVLVGSLIATIFAMPLNAPLLLNRPAGIRPRSPEDANTVFGAFTYSWMSGIMRVAKARPLRPGDVWELCLNNRAEVLSRRFAALRYVACVWLSRPRLRSSFPALTQEQDPDAQAHARLGPRHRHRRVAQARSLDLGLPPPLLDPEDPREPNARIRYS